MKRIVSLILVCLLLVGSVFALASCGNTISGKYEGEIEVNLLLTKGTYTVTYDFKGDEVTISSVLSTDLGSIAPKSLTASYEISEDEGGHKIITFNYGDKEEVEGAAKSGIPVSFSQGTADGVKYIEIAGIRYTAAK